MGTGKSKAKSIPNKVALRVFNTWKKSAENVVPKSSKRDSMLVAIHKVLANIPPSDRAELDLDLSGLGLGDGGVATLLHALEKEHRPVTSLSLRKNKIPATGMMSIANYVLLDVTMVELDISKNALDLHTLKALIGSLSVNKSLRSLNMSGCSLGDDGAIEVANLVTSNRILRHLDVSNNGIGKTGVTMLLAALEGNHILTELSVSRNKGATSSLSSSIEDKEGYNEMFASIIDRCVTKAASKGGNVKKSLSRHKSIRGNSNWKKTHLPTSMKAGLKRVSKKRTKSKRFTIGVADTIGRRNEMQDVYVIRGKFMGDKKTDLVAVFDGHGGTDAAKFAGKYLHEILGKKLKQGVEPALALREAFRETSAKMTMLEIQSGTTAVVALIVGSRRYIANVGDSRAVLCRSGRAVRVTTDHKPEDFEEEQRIREAGGYVADGRINGLLAVSRALGDTFLQPFVSAVPDIFTGKLTREDRFLVLGCDGVWDVLKDSQAIAICSMAPDAKQAAKMIRDTAYQRGSTDNITVIVVFLRDKKGKSLLGAPTPQKPKRGGRRRANTLDVNLSSRGSQNGGLRRTGSTSQLRRATSSGRLSEAGGSSTGMKRSRSLDFDDLVDSSGTVTSSSEEYYGGSSSTATSTTYSGSSSTSDTSSGSEDSQSTDSDDDSSDLNDTLDETMDETYGDDSSS